MNLCWHALHFTVVGLTDAPFVTFSARTYIHEECLDPSFVDAWEEDPDTVIKFLVGDTKFRMMTNGYEPAQGQCPCCLQELDGTNSIEIFIRCDANS